MASLASGDERRSRSVVSRHSILAACRCLRGDIRSRRFAPGENRFNARQVAYQKMRTGYGSSCLHNHNILAPELECSQRCSLKRIFACCLTISHALQIPASAAAATRKYWKNVIWLQGGALLQFAQEATSCSRIFIPVASPFPAALVPSSLLQRRCRCQTRCVVTSVACPRGQIFPVHCVQSQRSGSAKGRSRLPAPLELFQIRKNADRAPGNVLRLTPASAPSSPAPVPANPAPSAATAFRATRASCNERSAALSISCVADSTPTREGFDGQKSSGQIFPAGPSIRIRLSAAAIEARTKFMEEHT